MKRFVQLLGFLALAAMLFSISTITMPGATEPTSPPVVALPMPEPIDDDIFEMEARPATVEYGAVNVIKNNGSLTNPAYNHFHVFISFPQAGHSTDYIISNWAHELYDAKTAEFATVLSANPNAIGEVNVSFDSYLIDNRYAGILFRGSYAYELTPDFEHFIQTFNIDLSRQILLETSDIFDPLLYEDVLSLLGEALVERYPGTEGYINAMDESWLSHLVIGHRGIIVYLPENEFLPEYFPTLRVLLSYRDLGQAVLIRNQPPLDAMPPPDILPEPPSDDEHYDDEYGYDYFLPVVDPQRPIIDLTLPIVAITFDDGPGAYTDKFLDLFEEFNIRVTFSVIGKFVNTNEEALVRASLNGHEIMGHSWDHRNLAKLSEDEVRGQILDTAEAIRAVTGVFPNLLRAPYGAINDTIRSIAAELGITMINWNLDPEDWKYQDADAIFSHVIENIRDRDIILSHETYETTLEAYTRLIPELISRGFQFVTVSELLELSQIPIEPGELISSGR